MNQIIKNCDTKSYLQQYECEIVENGCTFDKCLKVEMNYLHRHGIRTIGSCCGHHTDSKENSAYIQVAPGGDEFKMLKLGYKKKPNRYGNYTIFQPKTIIENKEK